MADQDNNHPFAIRGDEKPTVYCPKMRHEDCDPLLCNLKTVTGADIISRAYSLIDPSQYASSSNAPVLNPNDISGHEPTPEGETLHQKYHIGDEHYLHIFKINTGGFRYVSKGPGFRFSTNRASPYRYLKYGCGHWLDVLALRHFSSDGLMIGQAPYAARYSCDACIAAGTNTKA